LGDHVKVVLFSCSEYEARNYGKHNVYLKGQGLYTPVGRFLRGIMTDLYSWFKDKQLYEQDNQITQNNQTFCHPGFQRSFTNKPNDVLKHERLQTVVRKWHRKLAKVRAHRYH
jgi:THO complex subunit 2